MYCLCCVRKFLCINFNTGGKATILFVIGQKQNHLLSYKFTPDNLQFCLITQLYLLMNFPFVHKLSWDSILKLWPIKKTKGRLVHRRFHLHFNPSWTRQMGFQFYFLLTKDLFQPITLFWAKLYLLLLLCLEFQLI